MAALNGCYTFLKILVFTINFILWLVGIGVVAVSLWLLFDENLYLQTMSDQRADYYLGAYIILGIGGLVTIMGFLGCCGAWKESPWMLGTFFAFLVIILFAEVTTGVMVYFHETNYEKLVDTSIQSTVKHKYTDNDTTTQKTFDMIQEGLECCGYEGPGDWSRSIYNNYDFSGQEIGGIKHQGATFKIPRSCCVTPESVVCRQTVRDATLATNGKFTSSNIYTDGCAQKMKSFLEEHLVYVVGIGLAIIFMEIFGMLCSLCLCCALKRIDDLKA